MARLTHEMGVDRKITDTTKGAWHGLNQIEVPFFEWYYSEERKEFYQYNNGVFEAYAPYTPQTALIQRFFTPIIIKSHLKDALHADIKRGDAYFRLMKKYPPSSIWREVADAREIEHLIVCCNKHHLQQATVEEGRIHGPSMQTLVADQRCNDLVEQLLKG